MKVSGTSAEARASASCRSRFSFCSAANDALAASSLTELATEPPSDAPSRSTADARRRSNDEAPAPDVSSDLTRFAAANAADIPRPVPEPARARGDVLDRRRGKTARGDVGEPIGPPKAGDIESLGDLRSGDKLEDVSTCKAAAMEAVTLRLERMVPRRNASDAAAPPTATAPGRHVLPCYLISRTPPLPTKVHRIYAMSDSVSPKPLDTASDLAQYCGVNRGRRCISSRPVVSRQQRGPPYLKPALQRCTQQFRSV